MMTHTQPMPAEHLHSARCLAHAVICAVENLRDSSDSAHDFRLELQSNVPLMWADEYLVSGTADCRCHAWDIAQQGGCWYATCACGWKGEAHLAPILATREAIEHAEQAVAAAWALVSA